MAEATFPRLDPRLRCYAEPEGRPCVELTGPWILRAIEARLDELGSQLAEQARNDGRHWDLSGVTRLDHAGALLLWRAWGGKRVEHLTLRPEHEALFQSLAPLQPKPAQSKADWRAPLVGFGGTLTGFAAHVVDFVHLVGRIAIDSSALVRRP